MTNPIRIAKAKDFLYILPKMADRHCLIAGVTGTSKAVTLQSTTEGFSALGMSVFVTDVNGYLSGMLGSRN